MGRAGLQKLNALPPFEVPLPNHNLLRVHAEKEEEQKVRDLLDKREAWVIWLQSIGHTHEFCNTKLMPTFLNCAALLDGKEKWTRCGKQSPDGYRPWCASATLGNQPDEWKCAGKLI